MLKIIGIIIVKAKTNSYCQQDPGKKELKCSGFTSLNQLDFANEGGNVFEIVSIEADTTLNLALDSSLSFQGLKLNSFSALPKIRLKNFILFDSNLSLFKSAEILSQSSLFDLELINIDFGINITCNYSPLMTENHIFSDLNIDSFILNNPTFSRPICPIIFKNTRMKNFIFIESISPISFADVTYQLPMSNNYSSNILNITIQNLKSSLGYGSFVTVLNNENLLNEQLFFHIESIEFDQVYLQNIDGKSLAKFSKLNTLKLLNFNLRKLFKNGIEWISYLNKENINKNNSTLNKTDIFELKLTLNREFKLEDDDLCLFEKFPLENNVIITFSNENIEYILGCSCTIYRLYENFANYIHLFNDRKDFPNHCFNVNEILLSEQIAFCQAEYNASVICSENYSTTSTIQETTKPVPINCYANCKCSFGFSNLNYLECDGATEFREEDEWAYVVLLGISTISKENFKSLRLKKNGTLIISGVEEMENDLFIESLIYDQQFRLVIYNSSLSSLTQNSPFRKVNLTELQFFNCFIDNSISIRAFEGAKIDSLIIKKPKENSLSPFFKSMFLREPVYIRQFKLEDAHSIFIQNSYENVFQLDTLLFNPIMFEHLEELKISNTWLTAIDRDFLKNLPNVQVIKLENINLKKVISNYYESFEEINENWLDDGVKKRIYMGHDKLLFENEYFCYFISLNQSNFYIYDNVDYEGGLNCTCTMYWIYRNFDLNQLVLDPDKKYVPQCVQNEDNQAQLEKCLKNYIIYNPYDYCKTFRPYNTTQIYTELRTDQKTSRSPISFSTSVILESKTFYTTKETIKETSKSSIQDTLTRNIQFEKEVVDMLNRISTLNIIILCVFPLIFVIYFIFKLFYIRIKLRGNNVETLFLQNVSKINN